MRALRDLGIAFVVGALASIKLGVWGGIGVGLFFIVLSFIGERALTRWRASRQKRAPIEHSESTASDRFRHWSSYVGHYLKTGGPRLSFNEPPQYLTYRLLSPRTDYPWPSIFFHFSWWADYELMCTVTDPEQTNSARIFNAMQMHQGNRFGGNYPKDFRGQCSHYCKAIMSFVGQRSETVSKVRCFGRIDCESISANSPSGMTESSWRRRAKSWRAFLCPGNNRSQERVRGERTTTSPSKPG
jgi:hypothetical protein